MILQEQEVEKYRLYRRGLITEEERYRKTIQLWTKATKIFTDTMMDPNMARDEWLQPSMAISGADDDKQTIRQRWYAWFDDWPILVVSSTLK